MTSRISSKLNYEIENFVEAELWDREFRRDSAARSRISSKLSRKIEKNRRRLVFSSSVWHFDRACYARTYVRTSYRVCMRVFFIVVYKIWQFFVRNERYLSMAFGLSRLIAFNMYFTLTPSCALEKWTKLPGREEHRKHAAVNACCSNR